MAASRQSDVDLSGYWEAHRKSGASLGSVVCRQEGRTPRGRSLPTREAVFDAAGQVCFDG